MEVSACHCEIIPPEARLSGCYHMVPIKQKMLPLFNVQPLESFRSYLSKGLLSEIAISSFVFSLLLCALFFTLMFSDEIENQFVCLILQSVT